MSKQVMYELKLIAVYYCLVLCLFQLVIREILLSPKQNPQVIFPTAIWMLKTSLPRRFSCIDKKKKKKKSSSSNLFYLSNCALQMGL